MIMLVRALVVLLLLGPKGRVTARVLYTEQFGRWGGAVPTQEEQARWAEQNREGAKPKPYAGQRILVRAGKQNRDRKPVAEGISDKDGRLTLDLAPGDYCVVGEGKRHLTAGGPYTDAACIERWFTECDAVWHVSEAPDQQVSVSFLRRGVGPGPCYHGPSPPSAAPRR